MSRDPSRAGFSLLESVVAVAILGLMLPLLFQSVRSAIGLTSMTQRREAEWRTALDLMTEATATLNGEGGTREGHAGDLVWTVETTPADDGTGDRLFRVRVKVYPAADTTSADLVTLDTLRLWTAP